MGVVDAWRQRRGSWAVLREAYAPAVLDAVQMSPASGGTQRATVVLRARGPVERDLPAYTLQGYRLAWTVAALGWPAGLRAGGPRPAHAPPGRNVVGDH